MPDQLSQVIDAVRGIQATDSLYPNGGNQRGLLLQTAASALGTLRPLPDANEALKLVLALLAHVIKHRHTNFTSLKTD
jgi:hypothetical protein